ncbi:MAG: anaerobic glycerol-3-phosphate dehydrogenase subunit B [Deltaproteobacteria bacterium]|nr:anaerobic glycerol-3-phosphate dehydrogenase subunit B [Deltaproteobacteria bacterium]
MNTHEYDAVVIGGGIAGFLAALNLVDAGFKTAVISRGDPVCCLSTGCIDVLSRALDPLKTIKELPEDHPYRIVGKKGVTESLAYFIEVMKETTIPYRGDPKKNREILTPVGTIKKTCLVPETMAHAPGNNEDHIHIISFKGIKDFYPSYITSRISNTEFSVFDAKSVSTIGIAGRFEDKDFLRNFISWAQDLDIPYGKVALPAVLGLNNPMEIVKELSSRINKEVFEIPTLPPSIPGMRLFRALKSVLQTRGGHVYWGKTVSSVERQGPRIEAVTLAASGRPSRVYGRAFILATGSFVSGGLFALRDSVKETVFDLPVFVPGHRKDWFNNDFFTPGHAIEKAGILIDSSFRPKESSLENLFVCGSIIAHSEIMKNQCGHGLAIATGSAAAKKCIGELS